MAPPSSAAGSLVGLSRLRYPGLFNRIDHVPSYKGILSLGWPAKCGREGPINHPERNDSPGRNRILHQ
jgi:hypothetical protein